MQQARISGQEQEEEARNQSRRKEGKRKRKKRTREKGEVHAERKKERRTRISSEDCVCGGIKVSDRIGLGGREGGRERERDAGRIAVAGVTGKKSMEEAVK